MVTGLRRGETHVGTGTPGKDRLTSETPQPRTGGARGRHSRVVGGRRGVGSVSSVRPSVPAPVLRTRAAQRRSSTVRLRGPPSARHDPHYCFRRRRSADGCALRPAPAACATPSRPRGERLGQPTAPGPHVATLPRGVQPPSARPFPPRAPVRILPTQRPRLLGEHLAPLRVAHMDPSGPPPSSPRKLQPLAGCRNGPTANALGVRRGAGGGKNEKDTRAWRVDCFETRNLNHVLSLNSCFMLVDFQNKIKVDNSGIPI